MKTKKYLRYQNLPARSLTILKYSIKYINKNRHPYNGCTQCSVAYATNPVRIGMPILTTIGGFLFGELLNTGTKVFYH
jgi:hypothetical protein